MSHGLLTNHRTLYARLRSHKKGGMPYANLTPIVGENDEKDKLNRHNPSVVDF